MQLAVSGALWRSYFNNFQVWAASSNTATLELMTQSLVSGCVALGATLGALVHYRFGTASTKSAVRRRIIFIAIGFINHSLIAELDSWRRRHRTDAGVVWLRLAPGERRTCVSGSLLLRRSSRPAT